jgi:hypothetical protein
LFPPLVLLQETQEFTGDSLAEFWRLPALIQERQHALNSDAMLFDWNDQSDPGVLAAHEVLGR